MNAVPPPKHFGKQSTAKEVTRGLDLSGKVMIVTGGASGLGLETARVLALRGAEVIIAVRRVETGEEAVADIRRQVPGANVQVQPLDLTSQQSVRAFAADFVASKRPLHVLINNAGVMAPPFTLTAEGRELQFASNHLGHFLLTNLLLDKLKETANDSGGETRIVSVSSGAHRTPYSEGVRFSRLDSEEGYSAWSAYGQSKLANALHASELARRLQAEGVRNVTANALHPGVIATPLFSKYLLSNQLLATGFNMVANSFLTLTGLFKTIPQGAATTCFVATHPSVSGVSGKYFEDCAESEPSQLARDAGMARRLWEVSERMLGGGN